VPFRQKLPTPDSVSPAALPAWRQLIAHDHLTDLALIEARLAASLAKVDDADSGAISAVLVAISMVDGVPSVLLTRRSATLRNNAGDVSFPGGRRDADESVVQAAIREAHEEVSLVATHDNVRGLLASAVAARREISIAPVVAVVESFDGLISNPDEVDHVFVVPLAHLVSPGVHWCETWHREPFGEFVMHYFAIGDDLVWGATAFLLNDLLDRLASPSLDSTTTDPH